MPTVDSRYAYTFEGRTQDPETIPGSCIQFYYIISLGMTWNDLPQSRLKGLVALYLHNHPNIYIYAACLERQI